MAADGISDQIAEQIRQRLATRVAVDYGERLRSLLTDSQRRFVEFAESALQQLERVDAGGASRHEDLLDDLRPVDGEPSASPSPATDPVA